jgi:predicted NBD/HSP70 family sugar kinase/biotin operon repressor
MRPKSGIITAMGTLEELRELNRLRVVDALRTGGRASRAELVRQTGLSRTTIATIVGDLQARGLLVEDGEDGRDRQRGRGRPSALLRLNASAGIALGVDVGRRRLRVAIADLSATVLAERSLDLGPEDTMGTALDAVERLTAEALAAVGVDSSRLLGAGMGLPGPIDRRHAAAGSPLLLPRWVDEHAAEDLAARLGVPVEVDNDANLGALAERTFGAGRGVQDLVYVKVSDGIGAGMVLGGRLHHGATGIAGELGHVHVQPDGAVCRCGGRGCLGTIASTGALLDVLRAAHGSDLGLDGMLELLAGGDLGAQRVVRDAGTAIGRVLADLCNHVNPAAIIVGGDLSTAGTALVDGIQQAVDRYALPAAAEAVEVIPGSLGARADVLGALALVIGDLDRLRSNGIPALRW